MLSSDTLRIIKGYISNLKTRYGVSIILDDLIGISSIYTDFEKVFESGAYHNNSFCNYIKKNPSGFTQCIENKCKVSTHCSSISCSFYGKCHMGVEEFVFPIKWNDKLIAMLFVGEFYTDETQSIETLRSRSSELGLTYEECSNLFFSIAKKVDFSIEEFTYDVGILCEYILQIAINFFTQGQILINKTNALENSSNINKNNFNVAKTVNFIKENYDKDLSLNILASNIYCNPSYLSHIFKEALNINIVDYINQERIEQAKHLLDVTTKTIIEISLQVGYKDSSYFAKVFKQLVGLSPKEYRARKSIK